MKPCAGCYILKGVSGLFFQVNSVSLHPLLCGTLHTVMARAIFCLLSAVKCRLSHSKIMMNGYTKDPLTVLSMWRHGPLAIIALRNFLPSPPLLLLSSSPFSFLPLLPFPPLFSFSFFRKSVVVVGSNSGRLAIYLFFFSLWMYSFSHTPYS